MYVYVAYTELSVDSQKTMEVVDFLVPIDVGRILTHSLGCNSNRGGFIWRGVEPGIP